MKNMKKPANKKSRIKNEPLDDSIDILNRSPAVAFIWKNKKNWPVEFVSKNVKKLFGYTAEDFLSGKISYSRVVHPDDLKRLANEVKTNSGNLKKNNFIHKPYRIIDKYNNVKWVEDRTHIKRDLKGKIIHFQGIVLDITRSVEAELELHSAIQKLKSDNKEIQILNRQLIASQNEIRKNDERLTEAFHSNPNLMAIVDPKDSRFFEVNNMFLQTLGYKKEEVIGKTPAELGIFADRRQSRAGKKTAKRDGQIRDLEISIRTKTGEIRYGRVSADTVVLLNKKYLLTVLEDITEKKKTEQLLKETEELFRMFMEHSPIYIYFKDENLRPIMLSRNYEKMLGRPLNEILGKTMDELFPSELSRSMVEDDKKVLHERKRVDVIEEMEGRIYNTLKFPVIRKGKPAILAGFTMDITDQKRAENALIKSETLLKAIFENISDMITIIDESGKIIYESPSVERILGYSSVTFNEKERLDIIHPDDIAQFYNIFSNEIINPGYYINSQYRVRHKDGSWRNIEGTAINLLDNPAVKGMLITSRDITEQKRAENARIESETRFKAVIENISDMITIVNETGNVIYESPSVERILGYKTEDLNERERFDIVHPDDMAEFLDIFSFGVLNPGFYVNTQFRIRHKDGSWRNIEGTAKNLLNNPAIKGVLISSRDITEQNRAGEALKQSELKFFKAFHSSPTAGAITVFNDGRIIEVNESFIKLFGYTRDELIGRTTVELNIWTESIQRENLLTLFQPSGGVRDLEFKLRAKDGRLLSTRYFADKIEIDNMPYLMSIIIDETDRKKTEELLKYSEEQYRTLVNNMQDILYRSDINGDIIFVTPSGLRLMGYETIEEIIGLNIGRDFYKDPGQRKILLEQLEKTGKVTNFEINLKKKNGSLLTVSTNTQYYYDKDGNVLGVEGIFTDITERKRAENALIESEARFKAVVDNISDMIGIVDISGKTIYDSPSVERILGYKSEDLDERERVDIVHPDDFADFLNIFSYDVLNSDFYVNTQYRVRHKDGSWRNIEGTAKNLMDNPAVKGWLITSRDITERKRAENALIESEARFKAVIENISDMVNIVDIMGKSIYESPSVEGTLGYKAESLNERERFDIIHPDDLADFLNIFSYGLLNPGSYVNTQYRVRHKDGSWRYIEGTAVNLIDNPAVKGLLICSRDITERKRADELLRESEVQFRATFEQMAVGIAHIAPDGRWLRVNQKICDIVGYTVEELSSKTFQDITHPEDLNKDLEEVKKMLSGEINTYSMEKRYFRKDSSIVWVELTVALVRESDGTPKYFISVVDDITDRKRAEKALIENETRFRALVENITDMMTIVDEFGKVIYESPSVIRFQRMLGYESKDELQHNAFELIHPYDREELFTRIFSTFDKPNSIMETTHRVLHKDGSCRIIESISLNLITNPAVKGVVITSRDITERKRVENALIESETRFRAVLENISDMITVVDELGKIIYESPSVEHILGYKSVSLNEKERYDTIHPDDLADFLNIFSYVILNPGSFINTQFRIRHKDGSWRNIEGTATNLIDNPAVKGLLACSRDITERKRAEEKLRASEDLYRSLVLIFPDAVTISDLNGDFTFVSPQTARLHGYDSTEELLGKNAFELIAPEDQAKAASVVEILLIDGFLKNFEATFMRKDGSHFIGEFSAALNRDANGDPHSIVGYTRDITDRKAAQQMLVESEARFRALVENISDMITVVDVLGKVIYESPSVARILGYEFKDEMQRDAFELIHPDDREELLNRIVGVFANPGSTIESENRVLHKDGSWRTVESISINLIENPAVKGVVVTSRDITNRKRIEEDLKIRDIGILTSINGIVIVNLDGIFTYVNNSLLEMWHIERDEVIGFRASKLFENRGSFNKIINSLNTTGKWMGELKGKRSDGSLFDVFLSCNMIFNDKNQPLCIMGSLVDITSRKIIEEELEKYRQHLEELVIERTDELEKTQDKLLRQEKFSTIGKITATVSHELRNPLATIRASIFSLSERLKEKTPVIERTLDRAERNIERCDKIIEDLLNYTRYRELELISTDIDKWLTLELSEYKMPPDIIFAQELRSGAKTLIDRDRFRRCVINIIDNAKQAMDYNEYITDDAARQKRITVRSHISDSRLEIQVEDTGPGIPPDALDKIFEGLYSTKATGIGLGLPFVKQTMEQHGGGIEVQSELKKGTTITLWLPLKRT